MSDGLTRAELRDAVNGLREYVKERADGIDDRLDKLNGAVARHEAAIGDIRVEAAEVKTKVTVLNREVFPAYRGKRSGDDERPAVTKGDVRKAAAVLAVLASAVVGLAKVWTVLAAVLKGFQR